MENNKVLHSKMVDSIVINSKVITSVKKIANLINEFFVTKIQKIRSKFKIHNTNSLDILKRVIPKPTSKFSLKPPTISKVSKIISKFRNGNTSGFENISIKIFKKLNRKISPIITHLMTNIYHTSIYPDILQI